MERIDDPEDDDRSGPGPGMTLGAEDEAWNNAMGSLNEAQIEKLVDGLVELYEKTKAREKAKKETPRHTENDGIISYEEFRDRTGL